MDGTANNGTTDDTPERQTGGCGAVVSNKRTPLTTATPTGREQQSIKEKLKMEDAAAVAGAQPLPEPTRRSASGPILVVPQSDEEDGKATPGTSTTNTPRKYENETLVVKSFVDGNEIFRPFLGMVIGFNDNEEPHLYHIRYEEDGDEEDLDLDEMHTHVVKVFPVLAAAAALNDASATVPEATATPQCSNAGNKDCLWSLHGLHALDKAVVEPEIADFFLFISERQRIWVRRRRGDNLPWSTSPLFQGFSWCNNYRPLDHGTQYFHAHVVHELYKSKDNWTWEGWVKEVLWASFVYRLVNRVESFVGMGSLSILTGSYSSSTLPQLLMQINDRQSQQEVFFTGAHQVNVGASLESTLRDGVKSLPEVVNDILGSNSYEKCLEALCRMAGIGNFLSWQILCDLQESRCLDHIPASDDYCTLGPGAKKGLKLVFPDSGCATPLELARLLVSMAPLVYKALGIAFPYWRGKTLAVKEIEHALCEYSKFCTLRRAIKARGRTRKYRPRCRKNLCDVCKAVFGEGGHDIQLCDLCGMGYCVKDQEGGVQSGDSWVCQPCVEFEQANLAGNCVTKEGQS